MPARSRKSEATATRGGNENADESGAPAKKKSRSGARKKKPTTGGEALKNRNENASVQNASVSGDGDEDADEGSGDLFDLLRVENAATILHASDWRARYNASEISAVAEIYSLLSKAAGCSSGVTAIELQRSDCLMIMNRVVEDMAAGNLYGDDPLAKRSRDFKGFRENFLDFIDKCIRDASEGGELYDGTLFATLAEIVSTCAGSKARPLRMAATMMGLQMISSLITVVNNLQKARDLKQNQVDIELKKKKSGGEVVKSLKRQIESAQEHIELVEGYMNDIFTHVFTHRFRDCDENIRAACMTALGKWMMKHQLVFLTDFYLSRIYR